MLGRRDDDNLYGPARHDDEYAPGYSPYKDLDWREQERRLREYAGALYDPDNSDLAGVRRHYYNSGPQGGQGGDINAAMANQFAIYDRRRNSNDGAYAEHDNSGFASGGGGAMLAPGGSGSDYRGVGLGVGGSGGRDDAVYPGGSRYFDERTGQYRDPRTGVVMPAPERYDDAVYPTAAASEPQTLADLLLARYLAR